MSKKKPTFEEALAQLESIADDIEQGHISLEESIDKYEKGMQLVKHCREVLSKAEMKIQKLQQRSDGTLATGEFKQQQGDGA